MLKLYVVATPIGNLEDITLRAIKILKSVNTILCEDTRITSRLLQKYEINNKKLITYNDHSTDKDRIKILKIIEEEGDLAIVSDAGTPNISDPGQVLIKFLTTMNVKIIPIPGCSSIIAAISSSSLNIDKFSFLGFLPTSSKKITDLVTQLDIDFAFIFLERSTRLIPALSCINEALGGRNVTIAREITKVHEEILNDSIENIIAYFNDNNEKLRGEFVVIVEKQLNKHYIDQNKIEQHIKDLMSKGVRTREISEVVSLNFRISKKLVYDMILRLKE